MAEKDSTEVMVIEPAQKIQAVTSYGGKSDRNGYR
jgi:hypothetical protein